ncbi:MAG: LysR family transcriptional regulator [Sumerlaeia bacterium]
MNIAQLRTFLAVAESGSFTTAAKFCRISQPSLSVHVRNLENSAGKQLFIRNRSGVALTPAGAAMVPKVREIVERFEELERCLAADSVTEVQDLKLGAIPTMAPFIVPSVVREFLRRQPNAKLLLQEDFTANLTEALVHRKLDVCLMSTPLESNDLDIEVIGREPFYAVISRSLAARKTSLTLDEMRSFPFIVLQETHCLGVQLREFCHSYTLLNRVVCKTAQISTILELVAQGVGISILPEMALRHTPSDQVVFLPIKGVQAEREIALVWRRESKPAKLVQVFTDLLKKQLVAHELKEYSSIAEAQ